MRFFFGRGSGSGTADSRLHRVRMLRVGVQLVALRLLDDPAEIHHRHLIGEMLHDREVVRDEQVRDVALLLQVIQQVEDLRLDRNVQRRNRLVADDEIRRERQGAGDADALPLAAGKFVRIAAGVGRIEPDALEQRGDAFVLLAARWRCRALRSARR